MIAEFFQMMPIPADHFKGFYDPRLVVLSFMVATAASYIALDITGRLRDSNNVSSSKLLWIVGGAIAMGSGIWSMHFIGMLSFSIPGLSIKYDLLWTGLSLLVAVLASGFALYLLQAPKVKLEHYIAGGVVLGFAIASMHYSGMEAMLITLNIRYLPALFLDSVFIAIVASEAALWLAIKSTQVISRMRNRIKMVSALVMGLAICGMHYTGMAASVFTPLCIPSVASGSGGVLDPAYLSIVIAGMTFVILGIAFFASTYKEALDQQQFERARELGMAEISASVLHNVGNVLNSVNVSAHAVSEKISASKLVGIENLNTLFNENKQNLAAFLTQDPRGIKAVEFLGVLAEYWREEQQSLCAEMARLGKNLDLIKDTISTQQNLSKTTAFQQVLSINELLDEALLIAGLKDHKDIAVVRSYGKIDLIKTDKVKLLQVFVNLLRNAKDAVMESSNAGKNIFVETSGVGKNHIQIKITDNGIGILPKNINKIFNYGFTTKPAGHGFGLHTSAIVVNELGGKINVVSEGLDKGAAFIIILN